MNFRLSELFFGLAAPVLIFWSLARPVNLSIPADRAPELLHYLSTLERSLSQVDTDSEVHVLDSLRAGYLSTGWLHPLLDEQQPLPTVIFRTRDLPTLAANLRTNLARLATAIEQQPTDEDRLRLLLATELQRQYLLTLAGVGYTDDHLALADYTRSLRNVGYWAGRFKFMSPRQVAQIERLADRVARQSFAETDRYALLIGPLSEWYAVLTEGVAVAVLAKELGIAAGSNPFSTQYLNSVTLDYTESERELGRTLFFDPLLSRNWKRSCASCHQPTKAFTDGRSTSMAFDFPNRIDRNAPSLINIGTGYGPAGVDLSKPSMGHFFQSVFDHPGELNLPLDSVVARLNSSPEYRTLFTEAYGTAIDSVGVLNALRAFVVSLRTTDAPLDTSMVSSASPDARLATGFNTFFGAARCGSCHTAPYLDGRRPPHYRRPVLSETNGGTDYRSASLRNLAYTAPYGVTGRHVELSDYLDDHYTAGLSDSLRSQLTFFLSSLNGATATSPHEVERLPALEAPYRQKSRRRPSGMY